MRLFVWSALMMLLTNPFVLAEKLVLGMSQD